MTNSADISEFSVGYLVISYTRNPCKLIFWPPLVMCILTQINATWIHGNYLKKYKPTNHSSLEHKWTTTVCASFGSFLILRNILNPYHDWLRSRTPVFSSGHFYGYRTQIFFWVHSLPYSIRISKPFVRYISAEGWNWPLSSILSWCRMCGGSPICHLYVTTIQSFG